MSSVVIGVVKSYCYAAVRTDPAVGGLLSNGVQSTGVPINLSKWETNSPTISCMLVVFSPKVVGRKITPPPLNCLLWFVNVFSCPVCLHQQVSFVVQLLNPQLLAMLSEIYVENAICLGHATEV